MTAKKVNRVIREYVDDYVKYFPQRWHWSLKNSYEQNELFMKTRARRSKDIKKVFKTMNEHFTKLRDSDREEIREFYPGKTAEEMFLGDDKNEQKR